MTLEHPGKFAAAMFVTGFILGAGSYDVLQERHDKNRISVEIDKSVGPVMSPALPPGCRLSARGTYFCISTGDK